MKTVSSRVCIVGAGIVGAMVAARLAEAGIGPVMMVDAGGPTDPPARRPERAERWVEYLERPWPGDRVAPRGWKAGRGAAPHRRPVMYVGGQATHWTAQTPRFVPEDFQLASRFGFARDWPISYGDLEPFYAEAERRLGVSGEADGGDRSGPFPMPPVEMSHDLRQIQGWSRRGGLELTAAPYAKNSRPYDGRPACVRCDTCYVCPTGAKYSPDFTLRALVDSQKLSVRSDTAVRRLEVDGAGRIARLRAVDTNTGEEFVLEAEEFVLANGFPFAPHLLAQSKSPEFPNGLANSSGTLGRYIQGHPVIIVNLAIPERVSGWMHEQNRLMTRRYMGAPTEGARFDVSAMAVPHLPYLRNAAGEVQFGDQLVEEWSRRSEGGLVQLRSLVDVYFGGQSRIENDPKALFPWGEPMPRPVFVDEELTQRQREAGGFAVGKLVEELTAKAGGSSAYVLGPTGHPHPGGGCRMGDDPDTSVCDSWGRSHDHENLYVTGAPLLVTGGCTNTTLTFCALALRTADRLGEKLGGAVPADSAAVSRAL